MPSIANDLDPPAEIGTSSINEDISVSAFERPMDVTIFIDEEKGEESGVSGATEQEQEIKIAGTSAKELKEENECQNFKGDKMTPCEQSLQEEKHIDSVIQQSAGVEDAKDTPSPAPQKEETEELQLIAENEEASNEMKKLEGNKNGEVSQADSFERVEKDDERSSEHSTEENVAIEAQEKSISILEDGKDDSVTATSTPVEISLPDEKDSVQSADLPSPFEVVDMPAVMDENTQPAEDDHAKEEANTVKAASQNGNSMTLPDNSPDPSPKAVGGAEPPTIVVSLAKEEDSIPSPVVASPAPIVRSTPVPPPRRPSSYVSTTGSLTKNPSAASFRSGKLFSTPPPIPEEKKKKKGMFSWLGGDSSKKKNKEVLESVSDGLRKIYKQKLYPLEEFYKFHDFHSPALDDPDFDAKPMILLVGQYSTGKTTFIRYLLEQDFPGIRIGPEPTTDRFIAVMHAEEEGVIPGNALVVDAKKQFRALSGFGNAFLNRFQCSTLPNQVLESITIVDTPGILSGEKQRIDRGYDFTGVLEWFAERVDRIILLFDAHKLDISDEFKRCIEALGGNEDKIRIVLNKSDMVDHQQLMRVYGALMWSLGKLTCTNTNEPVFRTPEVSRVYLGSFWDKPLTYDINRRLFVDEQHDLFQDLQALPRNAALRKLNDLIKRARLAKVHAYIISELRKQMPSMIGKDKKKKELIQNLDKIFEQIQREHNISPGDFPDIQKMREKLQNQDFAKFNPLKPKLLEVVDGMLASDIARLMAQIPKEEQTANAENKEQPTVKGGAFAQAQEAETPFGFGRYGTAWGEGFDKGADEQGWVVSRERSTADSTFDSLNPVNGFISGRAAKEHMVKSKLPNAVLGKIWKLADVDQDGQLDTDEFALANYLINLKLEGHELPSELPAHLIPPSKRDKEAVYPNLEEE